MDLLTDLGICCFCHGDCNPCSQTCGSCARQLTMTALGWGGPGVKHFFFEEEAEEPLPSIPLRKAKAEAMDKIRHQYQNKLV